MKPTLLIFTLLHCLFSTVSRAQNGFSMDAVKSYPFPNELTASATGSRIAWAFNEQGQRNIYVAEGPDFNARRLTNYLQDDGQELSSVALSDDGKWVLYVRGGDHGSNWGDELPVNPTFSPTPPKVQIWAVLFAGGEPKLLGEGEDPVISPKSDKVAFSKGGQIYTVPLDGSAAATLLFSARGTNSTPVWSPDGSRLAFQSNRVDHSFIGVYTDAQTPIVWIDPQYKRDNSPRWSPDGKKLAFIRTNGLGGKPDSILVRKHIPWSIMTADVSTGEAKTLWTAPKRLNGSVPNTHGGPNLHWAANRIVFLSYQDGWPHLYSLTEQGGAPLLLTPGNFMCEHIQLSADGKSLVFAANAGTDALDIDRRHVVKVSVDRADMQIMTPGTGLEWFPVLTGDGKTMAFISATAQRPPLPSVMPANGAEIKILATDRLPTTYPSTDLVTPKQVVFKTPDGVTVHCQLFEKAGGPAKKPAIVYVHGGPPRQMLLGWNYGDYYANAYAMNQYLASLGYAVLSVNYRLGIGYGYEFHNAKNGGANGASEYIDIKAAGEWLAKQPQIDPKRIGIYGGSYGGFLTAMALGRDSKLFAVGVDIHGVHDRTIERTRNILMPDQYERAPDATRALEVAWKSSPIAYVNTWTSPVLFIHGDDDRNVRFSQSTDLVRRLEETKVPIETMVIVDDTHHFMMHANQVKVNKAIAAFFQKKL
ncbi:prolyl oligopeptidase family serine peptidase [Runella sp. CRIBMP]|uniref:S9 family peptidase n=1 Tax=Runella sp. CRIBMP TaxID=2683261 RepID=UPI0014132340|nr:prolyl oligopeptidase family serine peptidase [Runella sp. CRIBMP]NBB20343.1 prolyl oligopeptidase family serine peptidase [Runella sp. CRIBMP]